MKVELVKYLEALPHVLGIRIWLYLYGEKAANGNSIVNFRELAELYQVEVSTVKKAFDYKTAIKNKLISLVTETESTLVINFKQYGKEYSAKPVKVIKEEQAPAVESPKAKKGKKKIDLTVTNNTALVVQGDLPALTANNEFTRIYTEQTKRIVIDDYNLFYKSLQASMAISAGIPFDKIKTTNPLITGRDVVAFKDIALHFFNEGCKSSDHIIAAFQRVYKNWEILNEWCQNGFTPAEIKYNLTKIIFQIRKHNLNQPNGTSKQSQERQKRHNRIEQKDYSFLEKTGDGKPKSK